MRIISGLFCFAVVWAAACGDNAPDPGDVSITVEPPGANCATGGQRIDVTENGMTTTSFVCNGNTGSAATVSVATEPAGSHCASGGVAITTTSGGSTVTSYVCNGTATSVTAVAEGSGSNCTDGGVKLTDSDGNASYICNGAPGTSVTVGAAGSDACPTGGAAVSVGSNAPIDVCTGAAGTSVTATQFTGSDGGLATGCTIGGVALSVGSAAPTYVCNGATGADGTSVTTTSFTGSDSGAAPCAYGGVELQVGTATPSYVCNGSSLAWSDIDESTPAVANHGYVSTGGPLTLTLTLPATASVGSEIELIVHGTGDVAIAVASGGAFVVGGGLATVWTRPLGTTSGFHRLAVSADGTQLAYTTSGDTRFSVLSRGSSSDQYANNIINDLAWSGDTIMIATDSDLEYLTPGSGPVTASTDAYDWLYTAANGGTVAATTETTATISTGGPGGTFFDALLASEDEPNPTATAIAVSTDGSQVAVALAGPVGSPFSQGLVVINADTGLLSRLTTNDSCESVAWADGPTLFAACNGHIQRTELTGFVTTTSIPGEYVTSVATAADGETVYAATNAPDASGVGSGGLYASTDGGVTWTQQAVPAGGWAQVTTTAAGTTTYALTSLGLVYLAAPTGIMTAHTHAVIDFTADGAGDWFVKSVDGNVDAP